MAEPGALPEHVQLAAQGAVQGVNWTGASPTPSGRETYDNADGVLYRHDRYPHRDMTQLSSMWSGLCVRAGLPADTPFYVFAHRDPNVADTTTPAATGHLDDGTPVMAISDRLLARLSDTEALAIMAHEQYHFQHPDQIGTPGDESRADAYSARITGDPRALERALAITEEYAKGEYYADFAQRYPNGVDEQGWDVARSHEFDRRLARASDVHPPLADRIQALETIYREKPQDRGPQR